MNTESAVEPPLTSRRERLRMLANLRRTWRQRVVDSVDQIEILGKAHDESSLDARYVFMTLMSAGIAILGLLLSSPAVVIGAMLLSPLMGPMICAGFALAVGDIPELRRCSRALVAGTLLAVGISAIIVFLSPIQTVTQEIASRTRPNLFDLLVALFSGLAGAYAMIRGRAGTIVGVAIATALMPPLAVIGFGLATFNWTVFGGALLLYLTNLVTLALSAAVMARFYGFCTELTKKQTRLQVAGILLAFAVLAIPLAIALKQIAWEANAARQARAVLQEVFPRQARLTQIDLDTSGPVPLVTASALTPNFRPSAEADAARTLTMALGRPIQVRIDQYRVGTEPGAAEAAELSAARDEARAEASERQVTALINSLAVVAGADQATILVDRDRKRAIVPVRPIPGADLAAYREIERRMSVGTVGWRVELRPPALALPDIAFDGDRPDPKATALIAWAALRIGAPVELSGSETDVNRAAEALSEAGLRQVVRSAGATGRVRAQWAAPDRVVPQTS